MAVTKKRIAVVDAEKCNPNSCAMECVKSCPVNRMGQECITLGERKKKESKMADKIAVIDENLCSGCGICPKKCPFHAITIINLPYEPGKPLHQYGKNSFRVYKVPTPGKGVVGLVGANGIGKSTLLTYLPAHLSLI